MDTIILVHPICTCICANANPYAEPNNEESNELVEMNLLTKQEVMQLFTIRDRTFYSWIEKGILVAHDVGNQKKYDISKALDLKNLSPDDVGTLLARPVEVESEPIEVDLPPINNRQQNADMQTIQNLKGQLEALKADLKEEREEKRALVSQIGNIEAGQKLLGEIKANENQLMEMAKQRENKLVLAFQEQVKEIILINKESDNEHFQQLIQKINEGQTEREKALKNTTKIVSFSMFALVLVITSVFVYNHKIQNESIENIRSQKDSLLDKSIKEKEDLTKTHQSELKNEKNSFHSELGKVIENFDQKIEKSNAEHQKKIDEIKNEYTAEKVSQKEFYERQAQIVESQLSRLMTEKQEAVKASDEAKIQLKILEVNLNNVLSMIQKNKDNKDSKELDAIKNSLQELQNNIKELEQKKTDPPKKLPDSEE